MIPSKITFRLGHLAEPLGRWCDEHDTTPSEATRQAVAQMLGVDAPDMQPGNPDIAEQASAGAKARWGRRRRKR